VAQRYNLSIQWHKPMSTSIMMTMTSKNFVNKIQYTCFLSLQPGIRSLSTWLWRLLRRT